MLVSPAEPTHFHQLGEVSLTTEGFGVDFLWAVPQMGLFGVQRKAFGDLEASINDGRLAKELGQMESLAQPIMLVEGVPDWPASGAARSKFATLDRDGWYSVCLSLQLSGAWMVVTRSPLETFAILPTLMAWTLKTDHGSLARRPKPSGNWGTAENRAYAVHLLESFRGVSQVRAEAILDHFGRVPLDWAVTTEQLMEVPGIGKVTAERMIRALERP